ncbi:MAG: ribonuclease HII [Levilactobacillus sp.]|jgi:ribonuclease HII|uniref:ribonuclease HII n=1 Tax=Levilactobacillus sp. TaxID=2767919 RepID=UPI0025908BBC|nr:ribonuclease HII [Levilactobacillus sp.]MCH4123324.1 ribonuclease HII [Levilactobacillus sp.]MCI1552538.1 ribonuclease HII [Levilactobacillus sp.]MCI1606184.1 ribonuclease HII [Levilactobacillus sp.]
MTKAPSLAQLKADLADVTSVDDPRLAPLAADSRKGAQLLLTQIKRRLAKAETAERAFQQRLHYERALWQRGQLVAGIDEVGRGPLAGPVVTSAVILPETFDIPLVNDSKQLTPKERERLYPLILAQATAVSVGIGSPQLIDQINIYQATRVAMQRAVLGLGVAPQHLIVDAMQIPVDLPQTRLIKGDAKSASVAAASIVAKVYRDHLMATYDELYPGYGFAQNAGYGTAEHLAGLADRGVTPIHRQTFSPVQKIINA